MATHPLDMRAGADTALARVVQVFGADHPHTAYLFANARANRMNIMSPCADGVADRLTPKDLTLTQPIVISADGYWRQNKLTYPRLGIPRQGVFAGRLPTNSKILMLKDVTEQ